jgi:hypothetical protein
MEQKTAVYCQIHVQEFNLRSHATGATGGPPAAHSGMAAAAVTAAVGDTRPREARHGRIAARVEAAAVSCFSITSQG